MPYLKDISIVTIPSYIYTLQSPELMYSAMFKVALNTKNKSANAHPQLV